jgi:uncharacterized protein (TIGR02145 family)
MKYLISCFFLLFLSVVSVNAQTLSNIDFFAEGKKVIITYDLSDCEAGEYYDVTLTFVEQSTLKVTVPKTISGDIKKVSCGSKRIMWDIGADVTTLSGRFYPELEVKKADKSIVSDIDGNTYKTVQIGTQVWMAENLKTAKYNDGTMIPNITDDNLWSNLTSGAWVYFNNDASYNNNYGKLYNWYAVSKTTNGKKNICPKGWHVPTDSDWNKLVKFIDSGADTSMSLAQSPTAGVKLKSKATNTLLYKYIGWNIMTPASPATDDYGFSALPAGLRDQAGYFSDLRDRVFFWSATDSGGGPWYRKMENNADGFYRDTFWKWGGFSVRCLKD